MGEVETSLRVPIGGPERIIGILLEQLVKLFGNRREASLGHGLLLQDIRTLGEDQLDRLHGLTRHVIRHVEAGRVPEVISRRYLPSSNTGTAICSLSTR